MKPKSNIKLKGTVSPPTIASIVSEEMQIPRTKVLKIINKFFEITKELLEEGYFVIYDGFISFIPYIKEERKEKNYLTKKDIKKKKMFWVKINKSNYFKEKLREIDITKFLETGEKEEHFIE